MHTGCKYGGSQHGQVETQMRHRQRCQWDTDTLTLNQDHVDINGANVWLMQPLALLQQVWNIPSGHVLVRTLSVSEQLPDGDTVAPHIGLVSEDPMLNALERHPLYWHLWGRGQLSKRVKMPQMCFTYCKIIHSFRTVILNWGAARFYQNIKKKQISCYTLNWKFLSCQKSDKIKRNVEFDGSSFSCCLHCN